MTEEKETVEQTAPKRTRAKKSNPLNVDAATGQDMGKKIPGRPLGSNLPQPKKDVEIKEVFFMTPAGVNCKKVYEVFRTNNAKHKRLLRIEKNVKF